MAVLTTPGSLDHLSGGEDPGTARAERDGLGRPAIGRRGDIVGLEHDDVRRCELLTTRIGVHHTVGPPQPPGALRAPGESGDRGPDRHVEARRRRPGGLLAVAAVGEERTRRAAVGLHPRDQRRGVQDQVVRSPTILAARVDAADRVGIDVADPRHVAQLRHRCGVATGPREQRVREHRQQVGITGASGTDRADLRGDPGVEDGHEPTDALDPHLEHDIGRLESALWEGLGVIVDLRDQRGLGEALGVDGEVPDARERCDGAVGLWLGGRRGDGGAGRDGHLGADLGELRRRVGRAPEGGHHRSGAQHDRHDDRGGDRESRAGPCRCRSRRSHDARVVVRSAGPVCLAPIHAPPPSNVRRPVTPGQAGVSLGSQLLEHGDPQRQRLHRRRLDLRCDQARPVDDGRDPEVRRRR